MFYSCFYVLNVIVGQEAFQNQNTRVLFSASQKTSLIVKFSLNVDVVSFFTCFSCNELLMFLKGFSIVLLAGVIFFIFE